MGKKVGERAAQLFVFCNRCGLGCFLVIIGWFFRSFSVFWVVPGGFWVASGNGGEYFGEFRCFGGVLVVFG